MVIPLLMPVKGLDPASSVLGNLVGMLLEKAFSCI